MKFDEILRSNIKSLMLLNHPFYKDWIDGKLSLPRLKKYAEQYMHHVEAFPRYISATHGHCEDREARKLLLENLMEEEGVEGLSHPEMWLHFAEGLGNTKEDLKKSKARKAIKNVISLFLNYGHSSYEEGLAALYAYEYQVPEIAETKIQGLIENYDISDKKTLKFFYVHKEADIIHRKQCEKLLNKLSKSQQKKALRASKKAAQSLWNFLTDIHKLKLQNAC